MPAGLRGDGDGHEDGPRLRSQPRRCGLRWANGRWPADDFEEFEMKDGARKEVPCFFVHLPSRDGF